MRRRAVEPDQFVLQLNVPPCLRAGMQRPEVLSCGPASSPVFSMKPLFAITALLPICLLCGCFDRSKAVAIPDIRKAPDFVFEKRLAFQGVAHPQFAGSYSWKGAGTGPGKMAQSRPKNWRVVVPLTSADWDRSEPVPLWVTFHQTREDQRPEIAAFQRVVSAGQVAGINVDFPARTKGALRGESAWQQAVKVAEQRHGLNSDPRAPIVSWRP